MILHIKQGPHVVRISVVEDRGALVIQDAHVEAGPDTDLGTLHKLRFPHARAVEATVLGLLGGLPVVPITTIRINERAQIQWQCATETAARHWHEPISDLGTIQPEYARPDAGGALCIWAKLPGTDRIQTTLAPGDWNWADPAAYIKGIDR